MDAILKDRLSMIAALGAGVVVGVSGIYLYYKLNRSVTRELTHLAGTIESLRREIEELKATSTVSNRQTAASTSNRSVSPEKRPFISSSGVNQYAAASSVEDPDEEYYDFTDTEEVSSSWATVNGPLSGNVTSSSKADFFNEIDEMLDDSTSDKESIYCILTEKKDEYSKNGDYLWRLAKTTHLCGIVAQKRGEMNKKRELAYEAFQYAKDALALEEENPEVHKWYAITIGSLAEYVETQEKIENGNTFKRHVDKAIELKPHDPTLYHMLGRWCYEVAMLSWLERKIASTLFSTPPEATLEEARTHLLKANELKGSWKENMLFIAKAYIGEGDYSNAISWIDDAILLPSEREDDEIAQAELETLQYRYQSYRI